jgi:hypothetical protein
MASPYMLKVMAAEALLENGETANVAVYAYKDYSTEVGNYARHNMRYFDKKAAAGRRNKWICVGKLVGNQVHVEIGAPAMRVSRPIGSIRDTIFDTGRAGTAAANRSTVVAAGKRCKVLD